MIKMYLNLKTKNIDKIHEMKYVPVSPSSLTYIIETITKKRLKKEEALKLRDFMRMQYVLGMVFKKISVPFSATVKLGIFLSKYFPNEIIERELTIPTKPYYMIDDALLLILDENYIRNHPSILIKHAEKRVLLRHDSFYQNIQYEVSKINLVDRNSLSDKQLKRLITKDPWYKEYLSSESFKKVLELGIKYIRRVQHVSPVNFNQISSLIENFKDVVKYFDIDIVVDELLTAEMPLSLRLYTYYVLSGRKYYTKDDVVRFLGLIHKWKKYYLMGLPASAGGSDMYLMDYSKYASFDHPITLMRKRAYNFGNKRCYKVDKGMRIEKLLIKSGFWEKLF